MTDDRFCLSTLATLGLNTLDFSTRSADMIVRFMKAEAIDMAAG